MRAVITGGSCHLGFNLVSRLLARGQGVRATVRSLSNRGQAPRTGQVHFGSVAGRK